jgi:hypothetical protein
MQTISLANKVSPPVLWTGRILNGIVVLFLLWDSAIKLLKIGPVVEAMTRLGYPDALAQGIGTLELLCTILYIVPRTAVFGTVLLTGFLGGAISCHVRIGDPLFSHTLFGVYVGAIMWTSLLLRRAELRAFLPFWSQVNRGQ